MGSRQAGQTYFLKKQHSHCDDDPESSDHDDDDPHDPDDADDPEPRQRPRRYRPSRRRSPCHENTIITTDRTIMIMIRIMMIIIDHGDQETTKPPPTSSPPTDATQQAPFHGHPIIAQSMVCRSNTSTNRHHIMPGDRSTDQSMTWRGERWGGRLGASV